jgi:hypothetical protein
VLQPIAIEAQETERIRRHVQSLLPATRDPTRRRVMVTSFPVASNSLARRESAVRGTAASRSSAAPAALATAARTIPAPLTADAVVAAVVAGRFGEIPRQVWLAATSICVGLLAGFLWWAGGRRDPSLVGRLPRQGLQPPRIDWSDAGEAHATDGVAGSGMPGQSSSGFGIGRAAALILAVCACNAPLRAADFEPTAAVAPLPEAFLSEAPSSADQPQTVSLQTAASSSVAPARHAGVGSGAPQVLPALPLNSHGDAAATDLATGLTGAAARSGQLTDWKLLGAIAAAFGVLAAATAFNRRRASVLPPDVFEVLGEGSLGGQHAVRIVRFGPKTLLVGVSAAGCQTLAELTDPQATACIAAACRGVHPPIRLAASSRSVASQSLPATAARTGGEAA